MIDPALLTALATALAGAALTVGKVMAEEAAKIGARTLADQFADKFLRGYKAKQHESALRDALQKTEAAFGAAPGVTELQAKHVIGGVNRLVKDANLQQRTLETMLLLDRDDPALISDELLRAFGLAAELRPALATFLCQFRFYFAHIPAYQPLIELSVQLRAVELSRDIKTILEALALAQGIQVGTTDYQSLKDYRDHIEEKHAHLSFLFVRPRTRDAIHEAELEAVFVPLQVHDPELEEKMRRRMERMAREERQEEKPQTINDILPRYGCILLKGAPGSGKTTLLRHLALAFARGEARDKLGWNDVPLLPIFVPLRNYGQFLAEHRWEHPEPAPGSLVAYVEQHFRANLVTLTPNFFRDRLKRGGCLLLLDALDEVSDPKLRASVAQHVNRFIDHYERRGNRFVLTSRPKGYEEVAEFLPQPIVCTVQPLAPEGRAELVRRLCRALERDARHADEDARLLLDEIPRKDKVDELSRNPLFCTTIVLVSKYRGTTLPERRVDIYNEVVELLLGFWDTHRHDVAEADQLAKDDGTGRAFRDVREAVEAKRRALAHVAYWMQKEGLAETSQAQVVAQLVAFFREREGAKKAQAPEWANGFLVKAHERSGLFVEGAPNVYNFSHQNWREYLAATKLVGELDDDLKRLTLAHIGDAWWEEVILLALALPDPVMSDPRRKMLVDEMLRGGHLLMAGKCAVDMGDRLAAPLRNDLITKLKTLMQSAREKPTTRASAGEILDALGWLPDDLDAFIKIPEGETTFNNKRVRVPEFWIGKYPVTCAQYQRFIDAGGYETERYWRDQRGVDEQGGEQTLKDEAWKWLQEWQKETKTERRPWQWDNPRFHRAGYPVVGVTWYEAAAYCNWLTEVLRARGSRGAEGQGGIQPFDSAQGRLPTSNFQLPTSNLQVRLPTETKWVRAAGGDANDRYPWDKPGETTGKLPEAKQKEVVLARANVNESEIGGTTPVAMYPDGASEPFRIWDMGGNMWEWTSTLYPGFAGAYLRGASSYDKAESLRVGARHAWRRSSGPRSLLGFRVCAR